MPGMRGIPHVKDRWLNCLRMTAKAIIAGGHMAVITISRQYGAGGKTLGQKVARKLGYYFAEDDIIQMVAREAKVSRDWVECIEREAGGTLLRFISGPGRKKLMQRCLPCISLL